MLLATFDRLKAGRVQDLAACRKTAKSYPLTLGKQGSEIPTLDWIGKKAVVNHHRDVPYWLIHCDRDKSVGDPEVGNLLVQEDNLEALKALLPITPVA